jgi:hypothetical protein
MILEGLPSSSYFGSYSLLNVSRYNTGSPRSRCRHSHLRSVVSLLEADLGLRSRKTLVSFSSRAQASSVPSPSCYQSQLSSLTTAPLAGNTIDEFHQPDKIGAIPCVGSPLGTLVAMVIFLYSTKNKMVLLGQCSIEARELASRLER